MFVCPSYDLLTLTLKSAEWSLNLHPRFMCYIKIIGVCKFYIIKKPGGSFGRIIPLWLISISKELGETPRSLELRRQNPHILAQNCQHGKVPVDMWPNRGCMLNEGIDAFVIKQLHIHKELNIASAGMPRALVEQTNCPSCQLDLKEDVWHQLLAFILRLRWWHH